MQSNTEITHWWNLLAFNMNNTILYHKMNDIDNYSHCVNNNPQLQVMQSNTGNVHWWHSFVFKMNKTILYH